MAKEKHIYGEVNSKTSLKKIFGDIRRDVENAKSRPSLTELYKRAGYLITLTHAPSWEEKFGKGVNALRGGLRREMGEMTDEKQFEKGAVSSHRVQVQRWRPRNVRHL